MDYIHKLPFLLGAAAAIIVGVICNLINVGQQDTYIRMAISMTVFFAIGVYIKNTLIKINGEIRKKKLDEELRILNEMEEATKLEEEKSNQNTEKSQIDIKVDDSGDDFTPLTVSEYLKSE